MRHLILLISTTLSFQCFAQQDSIVPFEEAYKRVYHITKVDNVKLTLDGQLTEDLWTQQGEWSERFVQTAPYERAISSSPTYAKVFYDDKYIYIGVRSKDAVPEKINRFIGNRDDNSMGDLISIAFDTYHDFRAAPEFNINAGGNKTDLIVTDKLDINLSWNAVWEGKTHVNVQDSIWTAELRIPFSQLRYNHISSDGIWGMHIRRIIRRNHEVQNWSMIPSRNNGHVFSYGELHGMKDLPKSRDIEILPYVMGKYVKEPEVPGSPYQKGNAWGGNAGLDAKIALSDFTLDLTINPDFGQIELDPSVMNLTAHEIFYDEKRSFFLEGKHIIDFTNGDDMMFYSRRIGAAPSYHPQVDNVNSFSSLTERVPIIGALKLTGTNHNGVTIGLMQSVTARSSDKVTRNGIEEKEVVEPLTNYLAGRVQKNWQGNTLLGGMVTSVNRALNEPHLENSMIRNALTAGVDFTQYFANRLYSIEMMGMFSSMNGSKEAMALRQRNPVHYYQRTSAADYLGVKEDLRSLNGTGGFVRVGRKGNAKWTFSETFSWYSPGFDMNDIGYLKQADVISNTTEIAFRQTNVWKMFRSNAFTLTQKNVWNYGGVSQDNNIGLRWRSVALNRYELEINETFGWNSVDSRMLRGGPDVRFNPYYNTTLSFNTDKAKRVMFMFKYSGRHNTESTNNSNTYTPSLTLRMGNHIYLSGQFNYALNNNKLQYITAVNGTDPIYLMGEIDQKTYGITMNLQVNVTPDLSLQFYGSPFTSIAKYSNFKKATNSMSRTYLERFYAYAPNEIMLNGNDYSVNTPSENFQFRNPNFSFNEFRSNLVARWEYMPGSTLYLVWEHKMSNRDSNYISGWGKNIDNMFGLPSTNTFMLKLNYWLNL